MQDVRADMSDTLDRIVPEAGPKGEALYRHDAEGMLFAWCRGCEGLLRRCWERDADEGDRQGRMTSRRTSSLR
jgi:hypothetical protein